MHMCLKRIQSWPVSPSGDTVVTTGLYEILVPCFSPGVDHFPVSRVKEISPSPVSNIFFLQKVTLELSAQIHSPAPLGHRGQNVMLQSPALLEVLTDSW